jgi:hypothetical protein
MRSPALDSERLAKREENSCNVEEWQPILSPITRTAHVIHMSAGFPKSGKLSQVWEGTEKRMHTIVLDCGYATASEAKAFLNGYRIAKGWTNAYRFETLPNVVRLEIGRPVDITVECPFRLSESR